MSPRSRRKLLRALLGAGLVLLVIGALHPVRAHVLDSFISPTRTMFPTLTAGDHFLVDKRRR
ncbi:MAG TPA: hypothetical protein VN914_04655, partial [Polyangia bacterium]|nr:hypothetical protein [Polyangia bacterium]